MGQIKNIKLHIVTDIKNEAQQRITKCSFQKRLAKSRENLVQPTWAQEEQTSGPSKEGLGNCSQTCSWLVETSCDAQHTNTTPNFEWAEGSPLKNLKLLVSQGNMQPLLVSVLTTGGRTEVQKVCKLMYRG